MTRSWLADVLVVNENSDPRTPGDVQIYRSDGEVGRQLEEWYVNEPHMALTGIGDKAILGLRGKLVIVERREPFAEGSELLLLWLTAKAQHILSIRKDRARKGKVHLGVLEEQGILPQSIEGLIAYVGFDH